MEARKNCDVILGKSCTANQYYTAWCVESILLVVTVAAVDLLNNVRRRRFFFLPFYCSFEAISCHVIHGILSLGSRQRTHWANGKSNNLLQAFIRCVHSISSVYCQEVCSKRTFATRKNSPQTIVCTISMSTVFCHLARTVWKIEVMHDYFIAHSQHNLFALKFALHCVSLSTPAFVCVYFMSIHSFK